MKLEEVIKSGKKFKRFTCKWWAEVDGRGELVYVTKDVTTEYKIDKYDILATDWELLDEPVNLYRRPLKRKWTDGAWVWETSLGWFNSKDKFMKEVGVFNDIVAFGPWEIMEEPKPIEMKEK